MEKLTEKLEKSSLKDELQFFFIPDPTPLTDEEIESGVKERPVLAVTSKNPNEFYSLSKPQTKIVVTSLGIISTFVFALGASGMNSATMDRLQQIADRGSGDLSFFTDSVLTTFVSLMGVQMVHEGAHRIVAWKDKVSVAITSDLLHF